MTPESSDSVHAVRRGLLLGRRTDRRRNDERSDLARELLGVEPSAGGGPVTWERARGSDPWASARARGRDRGGRPRDRGRAVCTKRSERRCAPRSAWSSLPTLLTPSADGNPDEARVRSGCCRARGGRRRAADALAAHVDESTWVVVTFPPDGVTDRAVARGVVRAAAVVYVSSTGVYGDVRGDVDDETPVRGTSARATARLGAEATWRDVGAVVVRAPGIYGPERGVHVRLARGTFRIPGDGTSFVSRIHVDDLAATPGRSSSAARGTRRSSRATRSRRRIRPSSDGSARRCASRFRRTRPSTRSTRRCVTTAASMGRGYGHGSVCLSRIRPTARGLRSAW